MTREVDVANDLRIDQLEVLSLVLAPDELAAEPDAVQLLLAVEAHVREHLVVEPPNEADHLLRHLLHVVRGAVNKLHEVREPPHFLVFNRVVRGLLHQEAGQNARVFAELFGAR